MYMKMFTNLRGLTMTDVYFNVKQKNLIFEHLRVSFSTICIPGYKNIWKELTKIKYSETIFKLKLLNELASECNLNHPNFSGPSGKQLLMKLDFETLSNVGVHLSHSSIIKKLLDYLEPFPFKNEDLIQESPKNLCIIKIRDEIEKQYLSWVYNVPQEDILQILLRLKPCLYKFRSIGHMRRTIYLLEKEPEIKTRNLAEKVYLMNQKPFSVDLALKFQKDVAGVVWYMLPSYSPKTVHHSHRYILSIVSTLRNLKFTETQIREGLPHLFMPFGRLFLRLDNIIKRSETSQHLREDSFLKLLFFQPTALDRRKNLTFTELLDIVKASAMYPKVGTTKKDLAFIISQFYEFSSSDLNKFSNFKGLKRASEMEIHDSLSFLKENQFTGDEVMESITIIFYPRELIAKTLKLIKKDGPKLKKFGFDNGCVPEETHVFKNGTKERRKTLQLCLYYMQK